MCIRDRLALVRDDLDGGGLIIALRRVCCGGRRARWALSAGKARSACAAETSGSCLGVGRGRRIVGGRGHGGAGRICICHCVFVLCIGAHRNPGTAVFDLTLRSAWIRAQTQTPKLASIAHLRSRGNSKRDPAPRANCILRPPLPVAVSWSHGQIRGDIQDAGRALSLIHI